MDYKIDRGSIGKLNEGLKWWKHTRTYLDRETGEIWVNEYADSNSYTQYHRPEIIEINMSMCGINDEGKNRWNKELIIQAAQNTLAFMEWTGQE